MDQELLEHGGKKSQTSAVDVVEEVGVLDQIATGSSNKRRLNEACEAETELDHKRIPKPLEVAVNKDGESEEKQSKQQMIDFSCIQFKRVLSNSVEFKRAVIEGIYANEPAVIILDKKPFTEDCFEKKFFSTSSRLDFLFQNDIYGSYNCHPILEAAEIKTTVIAPATQKHIQKYSFHAFYLVEETKEIYEAVVLPCIQDSKFSLEWVYNVLEHKKESERIVYEDTDPELGFILAPDLKWDGNSIEGLYVTALVHSRGIKSLRDLTQDHLPLLENILNSGTKAIFDKYGVKRSQLRIYVHYHPSYYHLHVHFNSIQTQYGGIFVEKAHLLTTIIDNIKRSSSYYQEATIPVAVSEIDPLYLKLIDHGYQF